MTMCLTKAIEGLRDGNGKIIDAALSSGFDSHDGFTRAFARQFGLTPLRYSQESPPVRYFVHYPVTSYYHLKNGEKAMQNEIVEEICFNSVSDYLRLVIAGGEYTESGETIYCVLTK